MKKTTFRILIGITAGVIFNSITSQAQITLTQSDMMQIGGLYVNTNDTVPTVSPGSAGASQTWNLAGLKNQQLDSIWALNPSSGPDNADFPGNNLCLKYDQGSTRLYSYGNVSSSALTTAGDVIVQGTYTIVATTSPNPTDIALPATYGSHWGQTYKEVEKIAISVGDTEKEVTGYSVADTVDGWGTVTTPAGSYNSLRIIAITTQLYDTVYVFSGGSYHFVSAGGAGSPSEGLTWVANGKGYPVAALNLSTPYSNSVYSGTYLISTALGVSNLSDNVSAQVYPNPANSLVNIALKSTSQSGYVKVMDITGREVAHAELTNGKVQMNTSGYANGMYIYMITDMSGNLLDKGKFSVAH